jgi:hypothetical protein
MPTTALGWARAWISCARTSTSRASRHRYAFGRWDMGARTEYGNFFPFYNSFGLDNNTEKNQDRYDDKYYKARYKGFTLNALTERVFWQRSLFRIGPTYEHYTSSYAADSYLGELEREQIPVPDDRLPHTGFQRLIGGDTLLDVDLRNRQSFARRGVRLRVQHDTYHQLNGSRGSVGLTQGFAEYYGSARLGISVTWVVKGGGAGNHGNDDDIPFYGFASLGLREGLRGYYRTRFTGDASLYLNTELRLALGRVQTSFLPFPYGVFGFYDRGRVYYKGSSPGGWHQGYGAGFYIAHRCPASWLCWCRTRNQWRTA